MSAIRKGLSVAAIMLAASAAQAEISGGVVRIGVLNDANGVFRDTNGTGSVYAAQLAARDFAASPLGQAAKFKVEVVHGDHQNKPDVGSALVRQWVDVDHVDAIVDVPNSAVGLAVNEVVRGTPVTLLASSTATTDLTGKACSPNTIQWVTDTYAIARAAQPVVNRGGKSWYFLTVDYALGTSIQRDATAVIEAGGGKVAGTSRHPLGTSDFSSYLVAASSSGAQVLGLANASPDTGSAMKQAAEFGIGRSMKIVAFLSFIQDIEAIGLQTAQGLQLMEAYYWDLNNGTRDFAANWSAMMGGGKKPSTNHAGVYSATLAYLNAAARSGSDDAAVVVPEMKRLPIDDKLFGPVTIRQDGRTLHATHFFEVKRPDESAGPWDDYKLIATVPAEEAFRPMTPGLCPLVK
jgi:branched-chain amino acid transport system substrate-binding protein